MESVSPARKKLPRLEPWTVSVSWLKMQPSPFSVRLTNAPSPPRVASLPRSQHDSAAPLQQLLPRAITTSAHATPLRMHLSTLALLPRCPSHPKMPSPPRRHPTPAPRQPNRIPTYTPWPMEPIGQEEASMLFILRLERRTLGAQMQDPPNSTRRRAKGSPCDTVAATKAVSRASLMASRARKA